MDFGRGTSAQGMTKNQGSGLFMSFEPEENLIYSLKIMLRILHIIKPLIGSRDRQLCHLCDCNQVT